MEEEKYVARCISLAEMGLGTTYPNPMVGAVLVHEGKIIGEGWHRVSGGSHAEVNAIKNVYDKSLLRQSTLYVNLEPCCHYGKTPPCTDLILGSGIPGVVIGCKDPNPEVGGQGIHILMSGGVDVKTSVLEENCRKLNRRFFTYQQKKRPYIVLKWAETSDGFMDILRDSGDNSMYKRYFISNPGTNTLVHRWRVEEQAILVGTRTAVNDNPRLTSRDWYANRQPLRIALDKAGRIPKSHFLYDNTTPTLIYSGRLKPQKSGHTEIASLNLENKTLKNLLDDLYRREIQSVLVEGGTTLLNSFIRENLWDEARIITSDQIIVNGLRAPVLVTKPTETFHIREDIIKVCFNN